MTLATPPGADPLKAVIYGRSSSANEKSIEDQNHENRADCTENGWRVAAELSDPTSASRYATKIRANWQRLLELLPKVDVVVLWEPSRGDRELESWAGFLNACRKHGVRIHATSHHRTYDPGNARDYRTLAEDGVDSTYESDKIRERTLRGKRAAYARGHTAGKRDFGYVRVYDYSTPGRPKFLRAEPEPTEAGVVQGIFADLVAGETIYAIAKRLNDSGVPTMRGAPVWRPGVVRGMALNPIYRPHPDDPERGCFVRRDQLYVAAWPPLIDEATWQHAQAILGANSEEHRKRRKASAPGAVKYLLSASSQLLRCGPCGGDIIGSAERPERRAHYACRLGHTAAPMPEADDFVTRLVLKRLSQRNARRIFVADDTASKAAAKELARLETQLAEALDLYLADKLSAGAYSAKEQKLKPLIEDARQRSRPSGAPLAVLELLDAAKAGAEYVQPAWERLTLIAKREVIGTVFSSLVLGPVTERITRWTPPEERAVIVAQRISYEWRTAS